MVKSLVVVEERRNRRCGGSTLDSLILARCRWLAADSFQKGKYPVKPFANTSQVLKEVIELLNQLSLRKAKIHDQPNGSPCFYFSSSKLKSNSIPTQPLL